MSKSLGNGTPVAPDSVAKRVDALAQNGEINVTGDDESDVASQKKRRKSLAELIDSIEDEHGDAVPIDAVIEAACEEFGVESSTT